MSITPNVLATRYATKEMVAIFDPINKIINERKFWITILKLQQKAGLPITNCDIKSYEKVIEKVDLDSIDKREIKTRHDVKARIEEFNALAGVEKIHIGLTSRDLTENIELIQIKAGLELIEYRVLQTLFLLGEKISKYEKTYMVGRSHNVAAQVTTLGKRFASCAEELLFAHTALQEQCSPYVLSMYSFSSARIASSLYLYSIITKNYFLGALSLAVGDAPTAARAAREPPKM